jgi:hypothetical protein
MLSLEYPGSCSRRGVWPSRCNPGRPGGAGADRVGSGAGGESIRYGRPFPAEWDRSRGPEAGLSRPGRRRAGLGPRRSRAARPPAGRGSVSVRLGDSVASAREPIVGHGPPTGHSATQSRRASSPLSPWSVRRYADQARAVSSRRPPVAGVGLCRNVRLSGQAPARTLRRVATWWRLVAINPQSEAAHPGRGAAEKGPK